ncbi:MAG: LacI family transcriptional regulator [Kiritimatiellaeota bacterium]|nr:LacI family transcriptional regulator [Kiritimatiellota bacterium]
MAGVAPNTARRALKNEPSVRPHIRERVIKAAKKLDYHPNLVARGLRDSDLKLVPFATNSHNVHYFGMLSEHIGRELVDIGMEPLLCHGVDHLLRVCRSFRARGCVLASLETPDRVRDLARGHRLVTVNALNPELSVANVAIDLNGTYRRLVRRFIAEGRKKIAVASLSYVTAVEKGWPTQKFPAVLDTLKKAGLPPAGGAVFPTPRAFGEWLERTRGREVDAVLCDDDLMAACVVGEMARLGMRTPEDVLVVGCDANLLVPGIWSVFLDTSAIAGMAVDLLRKALETDGAVESVVYKPGVVEYTP